jgi:hypothetical protein
MVDIYCYLFICPPISQIISKNFIKISLIIKECCEEILIKLAIVLKISKSSGNTSVHEKPYVSGVYENIH